MNEENKDMYFPALLLFLLMPSSLGRSGEKELLHHLLANYSRFVRPVLNDSKPVVVTFGFELKQIPSIVESKQIITLIIWMRMSWVNEYLKWDSKHWGDIKSSRLDYNYVWTPDIFLQEDVAEDMSSGPEKYKTQIIINSNGIQQWMIPVFITSSCIFEVTTFPFDRQSCTLSFTPWTHDQSEIDIIADPRPVVTANYITSSEWELIDVKKEVISSLYACCPNPFVNIRYTIRLHRKPLYYIYNVVLPCIIQMLIILSTFFLPPETGERIGVVITVLLVFAVYLEVLNGDLPRTSSTTPALSRFYITAMAESAFSIIATCCVLAIHFKGMKTGAKPIPTWVRKYFIDYFAKYFCVHHIHNFEKLTDEGLLKREIKLSYVEEFGDEEIHKMEDIAEKLRNPKVFCNSDANMERILDEVRVITNVIGRMKKNEEIKSEWHILAKTLDRMFFFIFFIIFLASSLSVLLSAYRHHITVEQFETTK